jgi:hypothetical protein
VGSTTTLLQGAPAWTETLTTDTPLDANSVEVDKIEPRPDNATWGPCLDVMVHSPCPSMPRGAALGNMVPNPGFLGVMDPRVVGLGFPGSPSPHSPPIS